MRVRINESRSNDQISCVEDLFVAAGPFLMRSEEVSRSGASAVGARATANAKRKSRRVIANKLPGGRSSSGGPPEG
ncbi:MAG: hypothetical protein DCC46_12975 [Armatimonadetes bacterium]|nr:MAG: hypothetical protein DCC46_12975 [Armatimonadota bacterium]